MRKIKDMRILIFLMVGLGLSFAYCSENYTGGQPSTSSEDNFTIKEIVETEYTFKKDTKTVSNICTSKYNKNGYLTYYEKKIPKSGSLANDLYIIEKLSYDKNNLLVNILEETSGGNKEIGSKSTKETILVYDEKNHLTKEINKYSKGAEISKPITYKLDGSGRIIEQTINNFIFYTFKYDSHSNIIEASVKERNIESSINYTYNSNNQLTIKTGNFLRSKYYLPLLPLNNKGSLNPKSNSTITCNEKGLVISSSYRSSQGIHNLVYEYEYDEKGNWIKQTIRNRNSESISSEVKREITYYNK